MIGARSAASGLAAAIALIAALGPGGPRPEVEVGARDLVADRAASAATAAETLADALGPALEAGRRGGALVIAGDASPGPSMAEAAGRLLDAVPLALALRSAREALDAARRARDPGVAALPPAPDPADLASIAGQLEASADAGDAFAEMRRRASAVPTWLEDALDALESSDPETAADAVAGARADHEALVAWEVDLVTLPIWLETTGAMIDAVDDVVAAIRAGDADAAAAAAAEVEALSEDAVRANRALQIAIAEGGGAIASAPMSRLATVLGELLTLREAIGAVRASVAT